MILKPWRYYFAIGFLVALALVLLGRLVYLNVIDRSFLLSESNARILRNVTLPATRGMVTDRQGVPLAVSVPVDSVWVNPQLFLPKPKKMAALAALLNVKVAFIQHRLALYAHHEFVYLKRKIPPPISKEIAALKLKGLHFQHEYKRYYPKGEVDAHVVGFTNVDEQGQEGLELAYNSWLSGKPGLVQVVKDRLGHVIATVKVLQAAEQGKNLTLSIDQRIQYLAYRTLKEAVKKYHAKAGSVVVLDPRTGEILAMVNQPSYNPNNRPPDTDGRYRNRAVTDMFEPGSVIKPFNVALALESGKYTPDTKIDTSPGWMKVGPYIIKDDGLNHGVITLTKLLQVSSNIGAAKVMLSLNPHDYWVLLTKVGFGERTNSGFPGESPGRLVDREEWRPSAVAALAYGYGIDVTELQLAHAYAVLANHGVSVPVTLLKRSQSAQGQQVIPADIADEVLKMLQTVVEPGGTGTRAAVPGYTVAGKTGTAYIAGPHGYDKSHYYASFVGVAPVTKPRLVIAVSLRDPKGKHFGGLVSAPVFAKVMSGALRILNVPPDDLTASNSSS